MKKIAVKNKCIGSGIEYIGWSGRGWIDGGPTGAGPLSSQAPSWDSYGQEIGINMVRTGFSVRDFLSGPVSSEYSISEKIKKGLENTEVSWAKSENTSYSYLLQRCYELGWRTLICVNPSYGTSWSPPLIAQSSHSLRAWREFCYHLAKNIEESWPRPVHYFEITNEPDIGYFDGESFLPHYRGPSGGITPFQYSLLLQNASEGIKKAVPQAKIIGPSLAVWNRHWLEEILTQSSSYLDGVSYHNVSGNLKDEQTLKQINQLLFQHASQIANVIFNSEWAWWPNHDIENLETALRIALILYSQAAGNAYGSLYLGPAQPKGFKKGLGVICFQPDTPNRVEKTKTFFAFRLMVRGSMGGKRLKIENPLKKIKILALLNTKKELVISIINPTRKKFRNVSVDIDDIRPSPEVPFLKIYRFDASHLDSCEESDFRMLKRFNIEPKSILQFIIPTSQRS